MEDGKICSRCKQEKQFSEFNKCKTGRHGLHNHCRVCQKEFKKDWYLKNQQHCLAYIKRPEVKIKTAQRTKNRYNNDHEWRERKLKENRERRRREPAKRKQRQNEKLRRAKNPNYRIAQNLRSRLRLALIQQGIVKKSSKTLELIGCSPSFLKEYIESLWQEGMSWDNYGPDGWHIDHIKPCCSFDLELFEEQQKCFHFTNLQPLWALDNKSKGGKI